MRKFNQLAISVALALTAQLTVAAEIDLLNLASRNADDTTLGDHVIVKQTKDGTTKYVIGNGADGQILAAVNLPMESEVRMKAWLGYNGYLDLFLLADEYQIKLHLDSSNGYSALTGSALVAQTAKDASSAWIYGYNTIRLALTGGEVKVYVNDVFSQKAKLLNANLVFNQLKLNSIDPPYSDGSYNVALYDLKAGGNVTTAASCSNGSSTTTTPISGTTNTGDLPQIASNLDIKIPRGLYSQSGGLFTPAGSIPVWADLKYNAQSNYWTLSGAGVLPQ